MEAFKAVGPGRGKFKDYKAIVRDAKCSNWPEKAPDYTCCPGELLIAPLFTV